MTQGDRQTCPFQVVVRIAVTQGPASLMLSHKHMHSIWLQRVKRYTVVCCLLTVSQLPDCICIASYRSPYLFICYRYLSLFYLCHFISVVISSYSLCISLDISISLSLSIFISLCLYSSRSLSFCLVVSISLSSSSSLYIYLVLSIYIDYLYLCLVIIQVCRATNARTVQCNATFKGCMMQSL